MVFVIAYTRFNRTTTVPKTVWINFTHSRHHFNRINMSGVGTPFILIFSNVKGYVMKHLLLCVENYRCSPLYNSTATAVSISGYFGVYWVLLLSIHLPTDVSCRKSRIGNA